MRGSGPRTGEGVHAGDRGGVLMQVKGSAQMRGRVQVRAPWCPAQVRRGSCPRAVELLLPSQEGGVETSQQSGLTTLSQTTEMGSCRAEKLPGVLGQPILRGPGRGSGHPPSGPGRDTSICKVRSGLEVSTERLCLPSQSPARSSASGPAWVQLGVASAWRRRGC